MAANVQVHSAADLVAHVEALAEIGPRPAGTAAEARAHAYAAERLRGWGARVWEEPFRTWSTLSIPWLIIGGLLTAAGALVVWDGEGARWVAMVLALAGTAAFRAIGRGSLTPDRLLANATSRNVIGVLPPRGEVRQRLVFLAHADTQRATWFWHPSLVRSFGASFRLNIAMAFWTAAMALGAAIAPGALPWRWLILPAFVGLLYGVGILVHREIWCQWIVGANDNASAVALGLELARHYAENPLDNTEVWCVVTGAEEVGIAAGATAFARAHAGDLEEARVIVLESLGGGRLGWLEGEGTFGFRPADPGLTRLAAEVAGRHPDWQVSPGRLPAGIYTDAQPLLACGLRALTVWTEQGGVIANYHWPTDVPQNIERDTLARAYQFVRELADAVDQSG